MATKPTKVDFPFVNSSITSPPHDLTVRALSRKQAIKHSLAARKRNGTYRKYNLRQFPVFFRDGTLEPSRGCIDLSDTGFGFGVKDHNVSQGKFFEVTDKAIGLQSNDDEKGNAEHLLLISHKLKETIPVNLSQRGYELLSLTYGFNLLDLSDLATFHVGRATRNFLSSDPLQLVNLLQDKPWSFFSYLPSSYDHSSCVKYAAECVVARVRQVLSPSEIRDSTVIALYVKALKILQQALNCPKQCFEPEILFAIEIMAIYELVASSEQTAWIRHAAGAARLIQFRGHKNYSTEFEKALFMAHAGAISNEAMLNNERCFLEDEEWREVFKSIIVEDSALSDRSEVVISLLMIKTYIPGIAKDVTSVVSNQLYTDSPFAVRVANRARQLCTDLLTWRSEYNTILGGDTSNICSGTIEGDSRCKVIGVYLSCLIISNRLLAAVSPSEQQYLEEATQGLVTQVLELQEHILVVRPQASLFLALAVTIAGATRATAQDWQETLGSHKEDLGGPRKVISRWRLERWCELFGRKLPL